MVAIDTIRIVVQVTPGSFARSLAINAVTEGISSNTVKKTTNTNAEKKVDFCVDPSGTARTPQHQQVQNIIQDVPENTVKRATVISYSSSGGYDAALKDFESIGLNNIKDFTMSKDGGIGKVGHMDDGTNVVIRSTSTSEPRPTLEVQYKGSSIKDKDIKVRY